jgi:hypothetical protein
MLPAIAAMIASAAISAYSNNQAAKKQQNATRIAQMRQRQQQERATDVAVKRSQEFDAKDRNDKQAEIEQELTQNLQAQVAQPGITAQGIQVGSTIPDSEAGGDYLKAKAREQVKSTESLRALAALMGKTGSAAELRRREAIGIGDTAGEIGRIGRHAENLWGADQAGIAAAGRPNVGLGIASAALGAYGMGQMAGGFGSGPAPTDFSFSAPAGEGLSLTNPSGMGLRSVGAPGLKLRAI